MSDEMGTVIDGAEAEAGPEGAPGAEATQQPEEPQVEYLEINDELGSKHVKIVIDGEETSVPLSELPKGFQRQADYTRKTQELAEQRREAEAAIQLRRAIEANPGLTVQVLAQRQGMSVEQFLGLSTQQQNAAAQQAVQQEPDYTDPLEQELARSNQRLQALEQRLEQEQADRELREHVGSLKQQYQASDEDIRTAVQHAMQMNLPPSALPMIYRSIAFERANVQQQTRQTVAQETEAQRQARQQAAAAAASQIGAGTGATGTTTEVAADGRMSLSDAILDAVKDFPD